jgi:hypothetical protein
MLQCTSKLGPIQTKSLYFKALGRLLTAELTVYGAIGPELAPVKLNRVQNAIQTGLLSFCFLGRP